jgi:hypothetical protein
MGRTAREQLAKLLDDAEAPGAFSAQILAPADALQVEVDGVGAVQIPVRAPLAKKLIAVAQPAKFGRGEQTLADTSVRDTWEIARVRSRVQHPAPRPVRAWRGSPAASAWTLLPFRVRGIPLAQRPVRDILPLPVGWSQRLDITYVFNVSDQVRIELLSGVVRSG